MKIVFYVQAYGPSSSICPKPLNAENVFLMYAVKKLRAQFSIFPIWISLSLNVLLKGPSHDK